MLTNGTFRQNYQTQSGNPKSMGRHAFDLFLASTLILSSILTTFNSAMAYPAQQGSLPENGSSVFLPMMSFAEAVDVENHFEGDGHDHHEDDVQEAEATEATAYMMLEQHITVASDGAISVDESAIPALAAESGIKESIFTAIVADLSGITTAQAEADLDELPALGTDLGCVSYPFRKRGHRDWWVWNIQNKLNQNHQFGLAKDSIFGGQTEAAVRKLQQHWRNAGRTACGKQIDVDGMVGSQTWALLYNTRTSIGAGAGPITSGNGYRQPTIGSSSGLCAYGSAYKRYGKGNTMTLLESAGRSYKRHGEGYISVGNISLKGGGYMAPHSSHQVGLDVDLRPMRTDNGQCTNRMQWNWNGYDRDATRKLINDLRATGRVKSILFNDPVLRGEGLTTYYAGHDNHLHVRFCEPGHSNARYRC